jgi:hypothetical protein
VLGEVDLQPSGMALLKEVKQGNDTRESIYWGLNYSAQTMTCIKECIAELERLGLAANEEPYLGAMRFGCLHHLPPAEIVAGIWLAYCMLLLVAMLHDDKFLPAEKNEAVKLLRAGKSVNEVFKTLRPNATPKKAVNR